MTRLVFLAFATALLVAPVFGQVTPYGSSTPPGFAGSLDTGGQLPIIGNSTFEFRLAGHGNSSGGALLLGFSPTSIPVSAITVLVNLTGALLVDLPPGLTTIPLGLPYDPAIVGLSGYVQIGVIDSGLPGGIGATNAIQVTLMPDKTPTRAYIPGQNFAGAPGLMTILDLSQQPPFFRATGSVNFSGNIVDNFPNKIAVADLAQIAYALGNSTTNQFVRAFNIASDPAGIVSYSQIGDIPISGDVNTIVGSRDMEAMSNGQYIFTASGSSAVNVQVFDTSNMPFTIPSAAIQTVTIPNAGSGAVNLALSPSEDRLAVLVSQDSYSTLTIYNITPGGTPPLGSPVFMTLGAFSGYDNPSDLHFTPDGHLLFVTGSNGFFNVIDTQPAVPTLLIGNGTYPNGGQILWCHGSAVAVKNGAPVGIVGGETSSGVYSVIDLNVYSLTFGTIISSFSTNPGGNISNHRMHAAANIVVATDGTGATVDCQMVDVIDLNQPIPGGFQHWRVQMPTQATLSPGGLSCIPRDFDLF